MGRTIHSFRIELAEKNRQFANMYGELFQAIEKETGLPCYQNTSHYVTL